MPAIAGAITWRKQSPEASPITLLGVDIWPPPGGHRDANSSEVYRASRREKVDCCWLDTVGGSVLTLRLLLLPGKAGKPNLHQPSDETSNKTDIRAESAQSSAIPWSDVTASKLATRDISLGCQIF